MARVLWVLPIFVSMIGLAVAQDQPASDPAQLFQRLEALERQVKERDAEISLIKDQLHALSNGSVDVAAKANRFTVKVNVVVGDSFSGEIVGAGHGSGYVRTIDERKDRVLIVTNRHVIEKGNTDARQIYVDFSDEERERRKIEAKLLHESLAQDMALLEVKLSDLEEFKDKIQEAPRVTREEAPQVVVQGAKLLTYGNPVDGDDIATEGVVSAVSRLVEGVGEFIQIDATINGGNSGGPLIDVRTGKVIGINTLKYTQAENTGFATKVWEIEEEIARFLENEDFSFPGIISAQLQPVHSRIIDEKIDTQGVIRNFAGDDFLVKHKSLLKVTSVGPNSSLQVGDIILVVNGELVGSRVDILFNELKKAKEPQSNLMVYREGKIQEITITPVSLKEARRKLSTEYLYLSGLIFQELGGPNLMDLNQGNPGVLITNIVNNSMADGIAAGFKGLFSEGVVLTQLEINGSTVEITSLEDLRAVLDDVKPGEIVGLYYKIPIKNEFGMVFGTYKSPGMIWMPAEKLKIPGKEESSYFTNEEISLEEIQENFDWSQGFNGGSGLASMMTNIVKPVGCAAAVSAMAKTTAEL